MDIDPSSESRSESTRFPVLAMESLSYTSGCLLHRLPNELLLSILEIALAPTINASFLMEDTLAEYYASLTLSMLVCRRWATLVKTSPALWSYVSFNCAPILYDTVLTKCQAPTVPLHVIYTTPRRGILPHPAVQLTHRKSVDAKRAEFSHFVSQNIKRVQSLILMVHNDVDYESFRLLLEEAPPCLESLVLKRSTRFIKVKELDLSDLGRRLRYLELDGVSIDWTNEVSFQCVERLSVRGVSDMQIVNRIFDALQANETIKELSFSAILMGTNHPVAMDPPPKIFPKLEKIEVNSVTQPLDGQIFKKIIRAPALKSANVDALELLEPLETDLRRALQNCAEATGDPHLVVGMPGRIIKLACKCGAFEVIKQSHYGVSARALQWLDRIASPARLAVSLAIDGQTVKEPFLKELERLQNLRIVEIHADGSSLALLEWLTVSVVIGGVARWPLPELELYEVHDNMDLHENEVLAMLRARRGLVSIDPGEVPGLPLPLKLKMEGAPVDPGVVVKIVELAGTEGMEGLKMKPHATIIQPKRRWLTWD